MINELVKERELLEERKIMEAIHRQAKDNYYIEKGKRYLKKQNKIKEVLHNELQTALLLVISLAGLTAWGLVFYFIR